MLKPNEVYLLQDLVLFSTGSTNLEDKIKQEWKRMGFRSDQSTTVTMEDLQAEANRIGHKINVKEVLAHIIM